MSLTPPPPLPHPFLVVLNSVKEQFIIVMFYTWRLVKKKLKQDFTVVFLVLGFTPLVDEIKSMISSGHHVCRIEQQCAFSITKT